MKEQPSEALRAKLVARMEQAHEHAVALSMELDGGRTVESMSPAEVDLAILGIAMKGMMRQFADAEVELAALRAALERPENERVKRLRVAEAAIDRLEEIVREAKA